MKNRYLIIYGLTAVFLIFSATLSAKSNTKTTYKPSKATLREVKRLEKDGWKIFAGDQSLAEQLQRSYLLQMEFDDNLYPKYCVGSSYSLGTTLNEAETSAIALAKLDLCRQVANSLEEREIAIEGSITNATTDQIEPMQTKSISTTAYFLDYSRCEKGAEDEEDCIGATRCFGEIVYMWWRDGYRLNNDAAEMTYLQLPHAKHAKTLLRAFRQVNGQYEVFVRVLAPNKYSFAKIGNLYYYLEDNDTFWGYGNDDTNLNKPSIAEVTYHFDYATLENVTIPAKVVYNERNYDVVGICRNAFYDCKNLKDIKYPVGMNISNAHISDTVQLIAYNPQPPLLAIEEGSLFFSDATDNNRIDAEEECFVQFDVVNKGKGAAENCEVRVKIKGATSGIIAKNISLPTIAVEQKCKVKIPITSDLNTQDGKVTFSIEVAEPSGWGVSPFNITIATKAYEPPLVQVVDYNVASHSGKITKMEPFALTFNLQNTQYGDAEDVKVKINLPKNIYLMDGETELSYPLIKSGEVQSIKISLAANNNYTLEQIPINVDIKEKHGKYAESKQISLAMNKPTMSNITIAEKTEAQKEIQLAMMSSDIDRDIPISSIQNKNTLVLIVANEHYQSMPTVPYAVNDGNIFKEYCVKTLGIPQENVMYQADITLNGFLQKVALLQKKSQARAQAGKDTHIIFYYTGHGMPDVNTQSAYLMPIDGFDENVYSGYKLDDLYQQLAQMPASAITVFLDACFSGVNRNDKALAVHKGARLTAKSGAPTGNTVVFAASQGNQTASVNDKEKHGLFTYYLLKKLKATKGEVSLKELADYLSAEVNMKSLNLFEKEQIPSVVASPEVEDQWQNWNFKR